ARNLRKKLLADFLSVDSALELGKGHRVAVPSQNLPIQHGAVGKKRSDRGDVRKRFMDHVLAPRPKESLSLSADQLSPDTVPFPLRLPRVNIAQVRRVAFERMGQAERIGLA